MTWTGATIQTGDLHPNSPLALLQDTCFQQATLQVCLVLDSSGRESLEECRIPLLKVVQQRGLNVIALSDKDPLPRVGDAVDTGCGRGISPHRNRGKGPRSELFKWPLDVRSA